MYLQITTKCNMTCAHCCYSCGKNGKHADYNTVIDMIAFARNYDDSSITIGGGEPTLHPRFFDILKCCLEDFEYVWFATNGSQTKTMYRLADIINGNDIDNVECTCETDEERDYCSCYDNADIIYQENKLSVALSLDPWHDPINQRIVDIWKRNSQKHGHSHFEIRNVSTSIDGPAAQGRAKKTGAGYGKQCVCADYIIKPDGKVKLCGCDNAPVIGDIRHGITEEWQDKIDNSDKFNDERCCKAFKK